MGNFNITILGCGSATPTVRHMPSAQAVAYGGRLMLIDCGEGTQLQLRRFGLPFSRITDIFISHLHGDHFLGLPGLLSTMALHQNGGTVTVHTFAEGERVLRQILNVFCKELSFDLKFDIIDPSCEGILLDGKHLSVEAFPLRHRVPCAGFIFREKPKLRHIDGAAARFMGVPVCDMQALREGHDWTAPDGTVVPNGRLTTAPSHAASYAYCSDTAFADSVAEAVRGADVLYHEATYGEADSHKARPRGHSTAVQAATIAKAAEVGRLVIGHYSRIIRDEEALADEARAVFPDTLAAREGMVIEMDNLR